VKRALLFVSATLACGGGTMAPPYPNRSIALIVPYGAGGPLDTLTSIEGLRPPRRHNGPAASGSPTSAS